MNDKSQANVEFVSQFEGYVYQAAMGLQGKMIAVQTTRSTMQGTLKSIAPDHLVIDVSGTPFYIRTQQIVWISPII
ncbi:YuzF family protein [Psychrobacillus antarcticus]|uniref:YuzF family protein n=1 Tax=Psychrobacillus antarcticus TaxID=2879115 RepID=UPI002407DE81|nr:YuzF family protein [Psychrobacillus antarcticus]